MTGNTWTFFHRDGGYDDSYRPTFRRYLCFGGAGSVKNGADGEGLGENRLTLQIRDRRTCLLDEDGRYTDLAAAGIVPGDRIGAGDAADPADTKLWRITSVTRFGDGIGIGRGFTITAE